MKDKEKTGALFFNDTSGNPKKPDRSGWIIINGVKWKLAGWTQTSSKGTRWTALKAEAETPKPEAEGF